MPYSQHTRTLRALFTTSCCDWASSEALRVLSRCVGAPRRRAVHPSQPSRTIVATVEDLRPFGGRVV